MCLKLVKVSQVETLESSEVADVLVYFSNSEIYLSGLKGRHLVERGGKKQPVTCLYWISLCVYTQCTIHTSLYKSIFSNKRR